MVTPPVIRGSVVACDRLSERLFLSHSYLAISVWKLASVTRWVVVSANKLDIESFMSVCVV